MGRSFQKQSTCIREFNCVPCFIEITIFAGLQAHLYITKLCWEGAQSYTLWKRTHPWYDSGYPRFNRIYCHPGTRSATTKHATPYIYWRILSQVRFALCSSSVFSRTDTATDSERFYNSILDLFEDVEELTEVNDLLMWWNRCVPTLQLHFSSKHMLLSFSQIFPSCSSAQHPVCRNSALARIKEKRSALRALNNQD